MSNTRLMGSFAYRHWYTWHIVVAPNNTANITGAILFGA